MKYKLKTLILLLFVSISGIFAQQRQEIYMLVLNEKHNTAKQVANEWIQKEPSNSVPYFQLGNVYIFEGNLDSAKIIFHKGIAANDESGLNYIGLGKIALMNNNMAEANSNFDKALSFDDEDIEVLIELGNAFTLAPKELGQKGIDFLKKAEKLDKKKKNSVRIYLALADLNKAMFNTSEAVAYYQRVMDLDPKLAKPYLERGKIYENVNKSEAENWYKKAIEVNPQNGVAYKSLSDLYYEQKKYDLAVENYKKYMEITEPTNYKKTRLASIYYQNKDYQGSMNILQEVLAADPKNEVSLKQLSYDYYQMDDSVNALKAFENYFSVVGENKATSGDYEKYASLLFKFGQDSLAAFNFEKAYNLDTSKVDLLTNIAAIHLKAKRWKDVSNIIQTKIAKDPKGGSAQDYLQLGLAYYFDSLYTQAIPAFQKFTELKPNLIQGWKWLATVNVALDPESDSGLAKPYYEKVAELALADTAKYKKDLIEAYSYLGYYYFLKNDNATSKDLWLKVKELDPTNPQAEQVLQEFNNPKKRGTNTKK
ncbi:MAG: tetratricopeptide repeat protein [Syntrophothermus sp.]